MRKNHGQKTQKNAIEKTRAVYDVWLLLCIVCSTNNEQKAALSFHSSFVVGFSINYSELWLWQRFQILFTQTTQIKRGKKSHFIEIKTISNLLINILYIIFRLIFFSILFDSFCSGFDAFLADRHLFTATQNPRNSKTNAQKWLKMPFIEQKDEKCDD